MARKKNKIAPAAKDLDNIKIDRETADRLYGDGLPFDLIRVETKVNTKNSTIISEMIEVGKYYSWVKAYLNHGEYTAFVERTANSNTYIHNCRRFAELYSNLAPVPNLGVRKTKALALLDKPISETYIKGGSLGDIPHDDVAKMTVKELEEEVRKLREKAEKAEKVHKEKIRQQREQIDNLENQIELNPPTKEMERNKALEKLQKKLFEHILMVQFYLDEAVKVVVQAQKVEGATFPQLQEWAKAHYEQLAPIGDLYDELDQALNNCGPDKPNKKGI